AWIIVDRRDSDIDERRRLLEIVDAVGRAVVLDGVGESVGTVVIGVGCVADIPASEAHAAVQGAGRDYRQRLPALVAGAGTVVAGYVDRRCAAVFSNRGAVGIGGWSIIHFRHRDRHRAAGGFGIGRAVGRAVVLD